MGLSYYREIRCPDGVILSIDKVVIDGCFRFSVDDDGGGNGMVALFFNWLRHYGTYTKEINYEVWESVKLATFRQQFRFLCDDNNSFWLGIHFNSYSNDDFRKSCRRWRLEFNPNKVAFDFSFWRVLYLLLSLSSGFPHADMPLIRHFDLAIDYPVSRSCCTLVKDGRTYGEYCNSVEDRTQTLGKHNHHGFIKLYNKQIESKLPIPLTRLELTVDYDKRLYDDFEQIFPKVYFIDDYRMKMDSAKLNDTDLFILSVVMENPEKLKLLGRKKKEKIERILDEYAQLLEISRKFYKKIIRQLDDFVNMNFVMNVFADNDMELPVADLSDLVGVYRDAITGEKFKLEFPENFLK